ncbi:hypothetical protein NQ314_009609 [Rhamnusium bicolor]|uniref:Uncharacterized protein n=1 Tax=Rhamnusium bicolor TaxID=1586634 RepID=A0AAV8XXY6_9CUCU|nr:hypothetical protein NQ314_009609 [Rhamnusium bicolor]
MNTFFQGSEVVNLLHGIPSTAISEKCQAEINSFLIQLSVRPIQVSANGFFILDKSQTLAVSIFALYFYKILIQGILNIIRNN